MKNQKEIIKVGNRYYYIWYYFWISALLMFLTGSLVGYFNNGEAFLVGLFFILIILSLALWERLQ